MIEAGEEISNTECYGGELNRVSFTGDQEIVSPGEQETTLEGRRRSFWETS